jgi:hypothetical protein
MPGTVIRATGLFSSLRESHKRDVEARLASKFSRSVAERAAAKKNTTRAVAGGDEVLKRIQHCYETIDRTPYKRSVQQTRFTQAFVQASLRVIYRYDFHTNAARLLKRFKLKELRQEVLIASPRRSGKTTAVSMFGAVAAFSMPGVEISIFSTGRRASKKLLGGIIKFLGMLPGGVQMINKNSEETVTLVNPLDSSDVRTINSYPSKVRAPHRAPPPPSTTTDPFFHFLIFFYYFT